jgi:SnoaL-like domain
MLPELVLRSFFERMQERDWTGAGQLLASDVHIEYTATGEQFDGGNFIAMNEAYPDGWTLEVVEVLSSDDRVAAQVAVRTEDATYWCAGFYSIADGQIRAGVEHWVTERSETPPTWRSEYTSP